MLASFVNTPPNKNRPLRSVFLFGVPPPSSDPAPQAAGVAEPVRIFPADAGEFASAFPILAVEGTVVDRLGDMHGADGLAPLEVCDGARHAQDAVVTAGTESQIGEGGTQNTLGCLIQHAITAELGDRHSGVGDGCLPVLCQARTRKSTRGVDPRTNGGGGLPFGVFAGYFLVRDGGDLGLDIHAVQHRARYAVQVSPHFVFGAGASMVWIPKIAATAGVHGPDQHKPSGEGDPRGCTDDRDPSVFQRLTECFGDRFGQFGHFVQEQNAVVGKGDLPGAGIGTAADHPHVTDRVVRGAEGAVADQVIFEQTHDRVDLGGFQGFFKGHVGQDGGDPLGKHGFAGAGRPDEQYVLVHILTT